jgi:site-specific recombinase XerD
MKNSGTRYPVEILTPEEALALIRSCSATAATGLRNRALLTVLYRTGLRLAEALALKLKDVDLERGELTVLHGKGNKRRVVGIDAGAAAVIRTWTERRAALGLNGHQRLFCTLAGQPIESAYVRALMPRLAAKAGILKRVHAHGLRHTHAAELAREGTPINVVQQQLGHSSLATTDTYLRHIAPQDVARAMRARAWSLEPAPAASELASK